MTIQNIAISIMIIFSLLVSPETVQSCTTAVVSIHATEDGRPILWKNRDTDTLANKVVYVQDVPYSYVGLVNADSSSGKFVYAGLNSAGFGIMNSVAYNLPKNDSEMKDLEGRIMADALRTCRTIQEFETYLSTTLGPDLGAWTNFCVLDSSGNTFIFETHNHGFEKINAADAPEKYLINTNFARTGLEGQGDGYLRFEQASDLFARIPAGKISCSYIFSDIARDLGHPLVKHPTREQLAARSGKEPLWIYNKDCINRPYTSAAVIIQGKIPGDNESVAIFWVLLGEPVTTIAVPVFVEAAASPRPLWNGKLAPIGIETTRIKSKIRPFHEVDKNYYMNLSLLLNKENNGFLPVLLKTEKEIFAETAAFLKEKHTQNQYAVFQEQMAEKALNVLKKIL